MYKCEDSYLYEIIEDYKEADSDEEREEIFRSFCSCLWACSNKRKTYEKSIRFSVKKDLLETQLGQIFHSWSAIKYKSYQSLTRDKSWCPLLRQRINNLYTRYFDKDVILKESYLNLLKLPKYLYCKWASGTEMETEAVLSRIHDAMEEAEAVKLRLQAEKMALSWREYKKLIEQVLHKTFERCKLIQDYEDGKTLSSPLDFITEDNFYVKYFNRSLEGELKNYQRTYYGVRQHRPLKRCKICSAMIENTGNKKMYCRKCALQKERDRKRKLAFEYRAAK